MSAIRVDFYLLATSELKAQMHFACRLLEKAYLRNYRAYVICKSKENAAHLDQLLWTYKDTSFVPHSLQDEMTEFSVPIQIGCLDNTPQQPYDILFNLTDKIPTYYQQFLRIIEIISSDEKMKHLSRLRYQQYRSSQCSLQVHSVN